MSSIKFPGGILGAIISLDYLHGTRRAARVVCETRRQFNSRRHLFSLLRPKIPRVTNYDVPVLQRGGQLYELVRIVPRWRRARSSCLQSVRGQSRHSPGASLRPLSSVSVLQLRNQPYELV